MKHAFLNEAAVSTIKSKKGAAKKPVAKKPAAKPAKKAKKKVRR